MANTGSACGGCSDVFLPHVKRGFQTGLTKVIQVRQNRKGRKRRAYNMNRTELLNRISIDPNVCFGKPCIKGHRIWVSLILDCLASGWTILKILENYPGIEEADIPACLHYGAEMSRERYVEIGEVSVAV